MGLPNVGKSTLLNALIGQKLSIITHKPQTTRHRIIAIDNGENFQMVFSDTPGIILDPSYKMQEAMNSFAHSALEDADILLYMLDIISSDQIPPYLLEAFQKLECPVLVVLNKIDLVNQDVLESKTQELKERYPFIDIIGISALNKLGIQELRESLLALLPEGPAYYPKSQFTDKSERFFVSEIIREKLLELYHQEIPYSCEVNVILFKEMEARRGPMLHISAEILVERSTQKSIIIGKQGSAIKELGRQSRLAIESFLDKKVFLELYVKVTEKWRDNDGFLKSYGYLQ